jgi:N-acetylglucosaminyldiphosphoundecaprenol N-acetyl-beta-D-mannosaminyltransferase
MRVDIRPDRGDLHGFHVDALTSTDVVELTAKAVATSSSTLVANHNMHSLFLYSRDAKMRAFYERAQYTNVDGIPVVFFARMLGFKVNRVHRIGAMDWGPLLLQAAAREGWRVFYLGSEPGVAEAGAQILRDKYPGLQIRTRDGFFDTARDGADNRSVVQEINAFQPDVLFVGMGMPRQERWLLDNLDDLDARVIFPVGAFMDYIAGAIPSPPRWLGPIGLEWLYRLVSEPRRLWHRYLVEPWFVLMWFARNLRRARKAVRTHARTGARDNVRVR